MNRTRTAAFTLVEIIVVVIVIGILAAVVAPRYVGATRDASIAATTENLANIQSQVDIKNSPSAIDPAWFRGGQIPPHPDAISGVPVVENVNTAGLSHPFYKVLKSGVNGHYWYNSATGQVRARVPDQGSSSSTLDYYNAVNQSTETNLGNYGGGGGGGS